MPDNQQNNESREPLDWQRQALPWWRYVAWFVMLVLFSWFWIGRGDPAQQALSYSQFKTEVAEDRIAWVEFRGDQIAGKFDQPVSSATPGDARSITRFITTLPPVQDPDLIALLERHRVEIRAVSGEAHWLAKAVIGVLPWVLIIGLFWWATSRMQKRLGGLGGGDSLFDFGKSRAKRFR
ncbi:MAG: cell division protein FtsH, partial [Gammaproteobacteria bacterium]|nr:cell division protein FtsH [Gammaproteobacteria bacterium]